MKRLLANIGAHTTKTTGNLNTRRSRQRNIIIKQYETIINNYHITKQMIENNKYEHETIRKGRKRKRIEMHTIHTRQKHTSTTSTTSTTTNETMNETTTTPVTIIKPTTIITTTTTSKKTSSTATTATTTNAATKREQEKEQANKRRQITNELNYETQQRMQAQRPKTHKISNKITKWIQTQQITTHLNGTSSTSSSHIGGTSSTTTTTTTHFNAKNIKHIKATETQTQGTTETQENMQKSQKTKGQELIKAYMKHRAIQEKRMVIPKCKREEGFAVLPDIFFETQRSYLEAINALYREAAKRMEAASAAQMMQDIQEKYIRIKKDVYDTDYITLPVVGNLGEMMETIMVALETEGDVLVNVANESIVCHENDFIHEGLYLLEARDEYEAYDDQITPAKASLKKPSTKRTILWFSNKSH